MSEDLVEEVYSSRHSKSPTFSNCGNFIFSLLESGQETCLTVANLDGEEFRVEIDIDIQDNITEIYSSHLTNHIAILTQKGRENAQIHVYHWQINDEKGMLKFEYSTTEKEDGKKHFWGGFDDDGFVFFRLLQRDDPDSWELFKWSFCNKSESFLDVAGYFPEMIGKSAGKWIWRNKITTTKSKLNGKGDIIPARVGKCRSSDDGNLYSILDYENASIGQISKISINEITELPIIHNNPEFVSQALIREILPSDETGEIPLGEIEDFLFVQENMILVHINENGTSKLLLADADSETKHQLIDLGEVENACGGKIWINVIKSSPTKKTVLLEVKNYNVSTHLWLYDLVNNSFKQFTHPDKFGITVTNSTFATELGHYGQISMQYLDVKQSIEEDSKGTVIFFHGGPAVQTHVGRYFDRVVTLAKAGYTVIAPNPAGSLGRGGKHINLDRGNHRIHQFNAQIIPFVRKFTKAGPLHLFGGSYAGWLIAKILNQEVGSNIKSAVIRNGVVDWGKFTESTAPFRIKHRAWEYVGRSSFDSDDALEILKSLSPGNDLKCPNVLFFTGKDDPRVPSDTTRAFLELCGFSNDRDRRRIWREFENEGHTIKNYNNRIEIMTKTLELFSN
jgi:pimeloyl-ACP methyl ester carboxylesterase